MRVAIIGGGALGTLLVAKLAPHAEVWVVSSHLDTVEALRREGARVLVGGSELKAAVRATLDPDEARPADLALICVKAYETPRAAQIAARLLSPHGLVLTIQNGLGNAEALAQVIPPERVLEGVTYLGASWLGPGRVRQAGNGSTYLVAKSSAVGGMEQIVGLFRKAGLEAEIRDDGASIIWGKLLVNAAINPLTALLRVPNGGLLADPARGLLHAAMAEGVRVSEAAEIRLPYEDPTTYVEEVCRRSAENYSSMLQDILRHRPTEIEAINGALLREGERRGMNTPLHRILRDLVLGLEASYGQEVSGL